MHVDSFLAGSNSCLIFRSPADVTKRLDRLVNDIRDRYHREIIGGKPRNANANAPASPCDVLLVAHGHILRAFAMRWIGRELTEGVSLLLEGMDSTIMVLPNIYKYNIHIQ